MKDGKAKKQLAQACVETFGRQSVFDMPAEGEFEQSFLYDFEDTAGKISERLYAAFIHQAEESGHHYLDTDGVLHGYKVIGSGIMNCVRSFNKYISDTESTPDEPTLVEALENPKTIEFFVDISKLPNNENSEFEMFFGLKGSSNYGYGGYFDYDPDLNCFLPNPSLLQEAKLAATRKRIERLENDKPIQQHERCVATRFIPLVWLETVEAYETEGLLTRDVTDA